jgi:hypothetical protein
MDVVNDSFDNIGSISPRRGTACGDGVTGAL